MLQKIGAVTRKKCLQLQERRWNEDAFIALVRCTVVKLGFTDIVSCDASVVFTVFCDLWTLGCAMEADICHRILWNSTIFGKHDETCALLLSYQVVSSHV